MSLLFLFIALVVGAVIGGGAVIAITERRQQAERQYRRKAK